MDDDTSNLEWKKNGFGESEKLTRKTNVKKALQFEATAKKPVGGQFTPLPADLPKGLKKLRKKIIKKDAYDEDEEEDENDGSFLLELEQNNSTLLNALHEDEKKQLRAQETLKTMNIQQTTGKMEAMIVADKTTKELGLRGLRAKTVNRNMQDPTLNANNFEKILRDDLSSKLNLSGKKLSERETITMLRGIKRVQNIAMTMDESKAKALQGMKVEKLIEYGDPSKKSDQQLAEEILIKSGRKADKKKIAKKVKDNSRNKELIRKSKAAKVR